jgi:dTDP-4-dehydrorhamnose 3,5-epimerase-like enzyme
MIMLRLIEGGVASDERGTVSFVNDFNFEQVKRFYIVKNIARGFIRAWHGHRTAGKYVYVVTGSALVGAVNLDTGETSKYNLDAAEPKILYIPPGFANGFQSMTEDTQVMFFSTDTLEEGRSDSIRFPYDHWDIWNMKSD